MTILYSDDPSLATGALTGGYATVTASSSTQSIAAPDYTLDLTTGAPVPASAWVGLSAETCCSITLEMSPTTAPGSLTVDPEFMANAGATFSV